MAAKAAANGSDGNYVDTLIVGAGISGINAAYRLKSEGPKGMTYAILENRTDIGGTWDLFKYPGLRSDSDIFTFGFEWSPWEGDETLADGHEIKNYIIKSAKREGIYENIRCRHKVVSAQFHSGEKRWHLSVQVNGSEKSTLFKCRYLILGTGYYNYEKPMETVIPGIENFEGKVIHPQFWPEDYDYTNKTFVIIGSGATAVTLLPSILDKAKHVTMLQRSPGYVITRPRSGFPTWLIAMLFPRSIANTINRRMWMVVSILEAWFCRTFPGLAKFVIRYWTQQQLPPSVKWDPNFKPRYNPWEQRFCANKGGDFYAALRSGRGDVVTDTVKTVTKTSIELNSGLTLTPDVIVTATGLKLRFGGDIKFSVDDKPVNLADKFAWKTVMIEDVPNLGFLTGYERASWTLGADVTSKLFIRIINEVDALHKTMVVPVVEDPNMEEHSMFKLSSTYLKNASDHLPKGGEGQWRPKSNYFKDYAGAVYGNIHKGLQYS